MSGETAIIAKVEHLRSIAGAVCGTWKANLRHSFQLANCMAATMTVYRRVSKDLTNLSARADIEYMRAGILQLGRIMPGNGSEPGLLQMFEEVLSSAQNLVWGHYDVTSCLEGFARDYNHEPAT